MASQSASTAVYGVAHNLTAHNRALSDAEKHTVIFIDPSYEPLQISAPRGDDVNRVSGAADNIYHKQNVYPTFSSSAVVELEKNSAHFTIIKVTDPDTFGAPANNNIWIVYRTDKYEEGGVVRPFFAMKNMADLTEVTWVNDAKGGEPTVAFLATYKDSTDDRLKATLIPTCLVHDGAGGGLKTSQSDASIPRSLREIDKTRRILHMLEERRYGNVNRCVITVAADGKTTQSVLDTIPADKLSVFDSTNSEAKVVMQFESFRLDVKINCSTSWFHGSEGGNAVPANGRYTLNRPVQLPEPSKPKPAGQPTPVLLLSVKISTAGCIKIQDSLQMKDLSYLELAEKIARSAGLAQISLLVEQKKWMDNHMLSAEGSLSDSRTSDLLRWGTNLTGLVMSADGIDTNMMQTIFILVAAFAVTLYYKMKSRYNMFVREDMDEEVATLFNSVRADPIIRGLLKEAGIRDAAAPSLLHSIVCRTIRSNENTVFGAQDLFPVLLGITKNVMPPRIVSKIEKTMPAIRYGVNMLQMNLLAPETFENQKRFHATGGQSGATPGQPAVPDAKLHYFVSAVAAEIERLTGVAATREADVVPLLDATDPVQVVKELLALGSGASLTKPNDADKSYIHPNVTFFNVGVLQAVCDLSRRGAKIEVCPAVYRDFDKPQPGSYLTWPKTPSVRVTFEGSNFVVKSDHMLCDIEDCRKTLPANTAVLSEDQLASMSVTEALRLTSDRVLKRATMVQSLPAVALLDVQADKSSVDFRRSTTSASMHCVIVRNMQLDVPRFAVFCKTGNDQWQVWRLGDRHSDEESVQEMCPLKYVSGDGNPDLASTLRQMLQTNLAAHDIVSATRAALGLDYNDPNSKYDATFWLDSTSLFAYDPRGRFNQDAHVYAKECLARGTIYGMPKTA